MPEAGNLKFDSYLKLVAEAGSEENGQYAKLVSATQLKVHNVSSGEAQMNEVLSRRAKKDIEEIDDIIAKRIQIDDLAPSIRPDGNPIEPPEELADAVKAARAIPSISITDLKPELQKNFKALTAEERAMFNYVSRLPKEVVITGQAKNYLGDLANTLLNGSHEENVSAIKEAFTKKVRSEKEDNGDEQLSQNTGKINSNGISALALNAKQTNPALRNI